MKQDVTHVPQKFIAEIDRGRETCCCLWGVLPAEQVAKERAEI